MIKDTATHKKTLYRAFLGFLCAFILVAGINFAVPGANAENNYISDIVFTSDPNDTYLGFNAIKVSFFVNTTFQITFWQDGTKCWSCFGFSPDQVYQADGQHCYCPGTPFHNRYILVPVNSNSITTISCPVGTQTFTAGQTYSFWLSHYYDYFGLDSSLFFNGLYPSTWGVFNNTCLPLGDFWQGDTEQYPFLEFPTLNITYPFENAEISQAFNVQGSYTIPTGYDKLTAYVGQPIPYAQYSFTQNLTDPGGNIDIRISGIPSGENYQMFFYFSGDSVESYYVESATINFSIVTAIPPELPGTGETPPEFFDPISADQYYIDFSNYGIPTALYTNLKNAIEPIFTAIGSNLTFFTSRFDSDTAKETGEKTGQAILIIRSYSSNLNTFFNDLPVSEFLIFYLSLLIMVIVFRTIKNLINLIKP